MDDKVKQIFSAYMVQRGHRKTDERFAVLKEIYSVEGHFDVETLYAAMKNKKYQISRATLYNTIELLLDCKLIRKHQFGKNLAQFEKCFENRQHDHLICTLCGTVMEFCDPRIQNIKSSVSETMNFHIQHHSLNLYGVCGNCRNVVQKN